MMQRKLGLFVFELKNFFSLCRKNHLDTYSAAAAFFLFVSLIPFFILFLSIIPYTPLTEKDLYDILANIFPPGVDSFLTSIVMQLSTESITLVSVSAVALLWTAARGVLAIKKGLNEIHNKIDNRNFIILRINAAFYMIIFLLSIFAMLVLHVFMTAIDRFFRVRLDIDLTNINWLLNFVIRFRPLISIVVAFITIMYVYTMLPNDKCKMKGQITGALFVSVCWYFFSELFSIYINNFNAYSMYGSMSIIIILMIWLYACLYILFVGAQLNNYLISRKEKNTII